MTETASPPTVTISLNGAPIQSQAATLAELVERQALPLGGKGCAVALNRKVVPRAAWAATRLEAGDQVEIIRMVVGG